MGLRYIFDYVAGETPINSVLADVVEKVQISESLSVPAALIGDMFLWKGTGLEELRGESQRFHLPGESRVRVVKVREAKGWGDQRPAWPESQEKESFVLRTYIVEGMGLKKLCVH